MSIPQHSSETRRSHRVVEHWAAVRRHWLFVPLTLLLAPLIGYVAAEDRGLMFGLAVACLSVVWIWWEGEQKPPDLERKQSSE